MTAPVKERPTRVHVFARIWGRMKFVLERFILRGPLNRLFVIAVLIATLATIGGLLVWRFGGREHSYLPDALWWAFLRLSDPGYLGDDTGTVNRIVSTALITLGYVVFLGSLVAIMTQWLNSSLARLQAGFTPLALNNHLLILGWSSRTIQIVREIMLSEGRVERFLLRAGAGRLRVVILAEEVVPEMIQELRERLGPLWNPKQVILRTGSPLRLEHLRRADFLHAAAILLPAPDSAAENIEYPDARTIKTILATSKSSRDDGATDMPLMVAELNDARKLRIAANAYGGPIETIASDLIVGRLLAQNIRHPGISHVYSEMLRHDAGSEIYLKDVPELAGRSVTEITACFPRAVPLGILRGEGANCRASLNPPPTVVIQPGDKLVLLSASFEDARPLASREMQLVPVATPLERPVEMLPFRRVLVLGWNHVVPAFIRELDGYSDESFEVDIISLVPKAERLAELARFDATPRRTSVRMFEGEYTSLADITSTGAASYHNVVILSSDRLESEGERDARSILGSLVLKEAIGTATIKPHVLVEVLDAENVTLVGDAGDETLLSPAVMSHILTQVALHRELRVVYDELFGPEGAEVFFRPASQYGVCERGVRFGEVQAAAAAHGEIALGLRLCANGTSKRARVVLNPERDKEWMLGATDDVVVLTNI